MPTKKKKPAQKKKSTYKISTVIDGIEKEIKIPSAKQIDKLLHKKLDPNERDYEITEGNIKDMLCNYAITITGELNHGDRNTIKGSGVVDKGMLNAMAKYNVHLACLDDAFKTAGVEFEDIDTMRGHELTANYVVTGFKIKGGAGNEQLILVGTKYISMAGDHMELQTPKIPLDNGISYTWYNELSAITELIREEISLYREGKYTEKEPKEKKDENQLEMFDAKHSPELAEELGHEEENIDNIAAKE